MSQLRIPLYYIYERMVFEMKPNKKKNLKVSGWKLLFLYKDLVRNRDEARRAKRPINVEALKSRGACTAGLNAFIAHYEDKSVTVKAALKALLKAARKAPNLNQEGDASYPTRRYYLAWAYWLANRFLRYYDLDHKASNHFYDTPLV